MPRRNVMSHPGQNTGVTRPRRPGRLPSLLYPQFVAADTTISIPRTLADRRPDITRRFVYTGTIDLMNNQTFAVNRSPATANTPASVWTNGSTGFDRFKVNKMRVSVCHGTAVNGPLWATIGTGAYDLVSYPSAFNFCYDNDNAQSFAPLSFAAILGYGTSSLMTAEGVVSYSIKLPTATVGTPAAMSEWTDISSTSSLNGKLFFAEDSPVIATIGSATVSWPVQIVVEWEVTLSQTI